MRHAAPESATFPVPAGFCPGRALFCAVRRKNRIFLTASILPPEVQRGWNSSPFTLYIIDLSHLGSADKPLGADFRRQDGSGKKYSCFCVIPLQNSVRPGQKPAGTGKVADSGAAWEEEL